MKSASVDGSWLERKILRRGLLIRWNLKSNKWALRRHQKIMYMINLILQLATRLTIFSGSVQVWINLLRGTKQAFQFAPKTSKILLTRCWRLLSYLFLILIITLTTSLSMYSFQLSLFLFPMMNPGIGLEAWICPESSFQGNSLTPLVLFRYQSTPLP